MKKVERIVYLGCPWLFGVIAIIAAVVAAPLKCEQTVYALAIGTGFVCLSLWCLCCLVVRLIDAVESERAPDSERVSDS